jgi:hypothetical protein
MHRAAGSSPLSPRGMVAVPAGVNRLENRPDQPSPGDLAVALEDKSAVVGDDPVTVLAPDARQPIP